jgi:hypothetical protein
MRLGVDFDNTLVCTDKIFYCEARARGWIPAKVARRKEAVRDFLRRAGQEKRWTELQGQVYGLRMAKAEPFAGALEALRAFAAVGIELCIISHKSLFPAGGPRANLHKAALGWLRLQGVLKMLKLAPGRNLFFETTRAAKLARIRRCGCTHFIDDLPEVLAEPGFPPGVTRILFDPRGSARVDPRWQRVASWPVLRRLVLNWAKKEAASNKAGWPGPERSGWAGRRRRKKPQKKYCPPRPGCALFGVPQNDLKNADGASTARLLGEASCSLRSPSPRFAWAGPSPKGVGSQLPIALLSQCGKDKNFRALHQLPGGRNNKVFLLQSGGKNLLLKSYFQHPADLRDRLGTEFDFLRFAWQNGLRQVPEPLACDPACGLALYEFIEGKHFSRAKDIKPRHLRAALDFIRALNAPARKNSPAARSLPTASEACFSIESHLACVERRLSRVKSLVSHKSATAFVHLELTPAWQRVRATILRQAAVAKIAPARHLPLAERIISPSDFGFHNALLERNGKLRFLDFEYAGWDDPAKLASDFLLQPDVPPPQSAQDDFVSGLAELVDKPEFFLWRAAMLHPLYAIKWCCILLNEFLPVERRRRIFARREENERLRQEKQLQKAREMLRRIALSPCGRGPIR